MSCDVFFERETRVFRDEPILLDRAAQRAVFHFGHRAHSLIEVANAVANAVVCAS
jgi:hypothetical protein